MKVLAESRLPLRHYLLKEKYKHLLEEYDKHYKNSSKKFGDKINTYCKIDIKPEIN